MGEGYAYFRWRALMLQKFGEAYFDTEWGALLTWYYMQGNENKWVAHHRSKGG